LFPHLANGDHYFDKYDIANPTHFDFDKKYTIQILNNIKYIKLRLDDSKLWSNILSSIFNQEIFLINDYQTTDKGIGDLYKRFKDEYKIPANYLELVKDCKYFKFYFSDEERKQYIKKWESKIQTSFTISYTSDEYKFYVNLYLENQYINDIQTEHYIDNGCLCVYCSKMRKNIFNRAKNGETNFEKIIHQDAVNMGLTQKINKITILNKMINKNRLNKSKLNNSNQNSKFGIKFHNL
jgi:hypothetical protein